MNKEALSALVAEILSNMEQAPQVKSGPYKGEMPILETDGSAADVTPWICGNCT